MGFLSDLFKKPEAPEPYDWAFLKEKCLQAIEAQVLPPELIKSQLDELDYDRLTASSDDAEEVVMEIFAVLKNAKTPGLSTAQAQEYLYRANEMLRSDISPKEAISRLKEMEESLRKK